MLLVSEKGYYKWLANRGKKGSLVLLLEEIRKTIDRHPDNEGYEVA